MLAHVHVLVETITKCLLTVCVQLQEVSVSEGSTVLFCKKKTLTCVTLFLTQIWPSIKHETNSLNFSANMKNELSFNLFSH